jgi:hypothetical protein
MKMGIAVLQRLEKAQKGNGKPLQEVGMGLASAPRPLGVGARSDWGADCGRASGEAAVRELGLDSDGLAMERRRPAVESAAASTVMPP